MPLADLVRALPGAVLTGLLPGLLLATALAPRWRWWERLAAAPGLSAGLAGVLGLAMHDLHVPFTLATVLPVDAAVGGLALLRWRRVRRNPAAEGPGPTWPVAAAALLAGLACAAALTAAFHDSALPVEADAPVHAAVAARIVSGHDVLPVVPVPAERTAWVRTRTGFEATAALTAEAGGPAAARTMLPLVLLAVLLLPLGPAALALETTGSRLVAALTPALAAGMLFPAFPVLFGELPLVVTSTLVVPLVLAARRALLGEGTGAAAALAGAVVAADWAVHGTEALTALVVGGPLLVALVPGSLSRATLRRGALLLACCGAAAVVVTALTRPPAVPRPVLPALAGPATSTAQSFTATMNRFGLGDALSTWRGLLLPTTVAVVLLLLGVMAAVRTRGMRWAPVSAALVLAAYVDVVAGGHLRRVWVATYPWSTDDRLASIEYFVLPLLMALGLVWAARGMASAWVRATRRGPATAAWGAAALAAAVGAVMLAGGTRTTVTTYTAEVSTRVLVAPPDLTVLTAMTHRLPPGATVLSDGADSGQWIPSLSTQALFFSKEYVQEHAGDARLQTLDRACDGDSVSPDAARLFQGVDAVWVGSLQRGTEHRWSAACLARVPWLRPVAEAGAPAQRAALFVVEHP